MICDECGETNKAGTEFCMFCGAFLGWQEPENPGPDDATQPLPATRASDPTPSPVAYQPGPTSVPPARPPAPPPVSPPAAPQQPAPAAAASRHSGPGHQPTPVELAVRSAPAAPPLPPGCPTCGRPIDAGRRFCGHCGEQFIRPGTNAPVTRPTATRSTWWTRLWNNKDRAARRAYRRSLPPLYRWRRVIIAVLVLGLIGAGLALVGHSPKAFVMARYYDLRQTLVNLPDVTASIIPPEASAAETTPDALVDNTAKPWMMNWTASTAGSPCGTTPTTAVIQLAFPPTRIREVDVRAGMLEKYPSRLMQFRPKDIWIAYGDECHEVTLADVERQTVPLDTRVPVDSVRIGVMTAYPPAQPEGAQQVLGFTEITLRSRPPVN